MERLGNCARLFLALAVLSAAITVVQVSGADVKESPNVAGRRVSKNEGKWQVAIMHEKRLMCSGSLIRNNVVLTSAECVKELELTKLKIRAGSKTFKRGGQVRKLVESVHHPLYKKDEHGHNIALLKLKGAFNRTEDNIEIVKLPKPKEFELPTSLFIYGWGISSLNANGTLSKHLRVSKYRVYSAKKCLRYLPENDQSGEENSFCVGDRTKQSDICNDDIGGPALSQNRVQYGVVSYGGKCLPENSIILTNVVPHLPWIREVLREWKMKN